MRYRHYDAIPMPNGKYAAQWREYPQVYASELFISPAEVREYEKNSNGGVTRSQWESATTGGRKTTNEVQAL